MPEEESSTHAHHEIVHPHALDCAHRIDLLPVVVPVRACVLMGASLAAPAKKLVQSICVSVCASVHVCAYIYMRACASYVCVRECVYACMQADRNS